MATQTFQNYFSSLADLNKVIFGKIDEFNASLFVASDDDLDAMAADLQLLLDFKKNKLEEGWEILGR